MLALLLRPLKRSRMRYRPCINLLASLLALLIFNEFIVYYVVMLQCQWPSLDGETIDFTIDDPLEDPLRVVLLADVHLLGSREGHWLDKLRREWQMQRSFQASMLIHDPDEVFILGDLFDEGKWCSDQEFRSTVARFRNMFATSKKTKLHAVVGNHDIGFHYMIDDVKLRRFIKAFDAPSVRMLRIKENIFILLNSMAFEEDGCGMCQEAETQLSAIIRTLNCAKDKGDNCSTRDDKLVYTPPIILQHFPMYRQSDSNCTGPDSATEPERSAPMKERWTCLAKSVSNRLLNTLKPRLIISGHTHSYCHTVHRNITPEFTIPSFNWRNINGPSFLLLLVTRNNFAVSKCYLPEESTVKYTYLFGTIVILIWHLFPRRFLTNGRTAKFQ